MSGPNLRTFATMLAAYARTQLASVQRGALLIRLVGDGSMVAGVFGNDNYLGDDKARREVELVRRQLRQASLEESGFGLSADGHTWALLVRSECGPYQTNAGKIFRMELLKVFLEDAVADAWQTVSCANPAAVPPAPLSQCPHAL